MAGRQTGHEATIEGNLRSILHFNMFLDRIPTELIIYILSLTLHASPSTSAINLLLVNRSFYDLCIPLLYSDLSFKTLPQLEKFSIVYTKVQLLCKPRSVTIVLAGGNANYRMWGLIRRVMETCAVADVSTCEAEGMLKEVEISAGLREVHLRLNSLARDPNLEQIYEALSVCKLESFSWTGPDPEHHFSIAIVPGATSHLFPAIKTWSNLRHLKLTNLAFSYADADIVENQGNLILSANVLSLPSLISIHLGQVTFLDPMEVARVVLGVWRSSKGIEGEVNYKLKEIKLVDAYKGSIWGARIKIKDIENAISQLGSGNLEEHFHLSSCCQTGVENLYRLHQLVKCEGKTERIVGGDRMDNAIT